MTDRGGQLFLLLLCIQFSAIAAQTAPRDYAALKSLTSGWGNTPSNWIGTDPCGSGWVGVGCNNSSRIVSLILSSLDLQGQLTGDIGPLSELQTFGFLNHCGIRIKNTAEVDLSSNPRMTGTLPSEIGSLSKLLSLMLIGCSFYGPIPDTIGSLKQLRLLSLNSNRFSGSIPPSIGNLSNLYWLDLSDNQLTGQIPVSSATSSGLDMLYQALHFHLGNNQLSGPIPPQIFNPNVPLIHVLLYNNSLNGTIPSTIGLAKSLSVVRFDSNGLTGFVPSNISNLTNLNELLLSNNKLYGPLPNLTGLNYLSNLDISNNTFVTSDFPPWLSSLLSLTTLKMENTRLQGQVPAALFSLSPLETVTLSNNQLNGTLDLGTLDSNNLQLVDMRNNRIEYVHGQYQAELILVGNPVCQETGVSQNYCVVSQSNGGYNTSSNNCTPPRCGPGEIPSPNCLCAYPYSGTLTFRAYFFSNLQNSSNFQDLQKSLLEFFHRYDLPVDSISVALISETSNNLELGLKVFPSGENRFNDTSFSILGFLLNNQSFVPPKAFGAYFFTADNLGYPGSTSSSHNVSVGVIVGGVVGGCVLLLLLVLAGLYAFRQKRKAEKAIELQNPFAKWGEFDSNCDVPQLKGARSFSFEDTKKLTGNFSPANEIGSGGYGKVYRAILPSGQLVAVKRAQKESMQGRLEFKTEIELLSRVHHKNLVGLVGFCFDEGEQMLVYEYIPNGNLRDSLSGRSGIRLDWLRRLRIALGAARGLVYLHELANPPIIHRDIKSNNILLDERLNAKVSDFGLSKLLSEGQSDHVTTQVKGTLGYMDPEYYMTQVLTEKSDVYSFGVVMLELVTGRMPIERGKYIVREVITAMDKTKDLYNLQGIVDKAISSGKLEGLEEFVDVAMRCVQESGTNRPSMGEVVKEIEYIMSLVGLSPKAESTTYSETHEEAGKGNVNHPYATDDFSYSGAYPLSKLEPQ